MASDPRTGNRRYDPQRDNNPGTVTGGSGGGTVTGRGQTWGPSTGGGSTGGQPSYYRTRNYGSDDFGFSNAAHARFGAGMATHDALQQGAAHWGDFNQRVWQETSPWRSGGMNAVNDLNSLRDRGYFQVDLPDLPSWNEEVFRSEYDDGQWGNPFFTERLRDADESTMRGLHNSGIGTASGGGLYELARTRAQVHSDDFNQARGRARDAYGMATQEGLTGYDLERNEKNQEYSRLASIAGMGLGATQDAMGRVAQGLDRQTGMQTDAARAYGEGLTGYADTMVAGNQFLDQRDYRERTFSDMQNFRNWQAQDAADFRNYSYADQAGFRERQFADQTGFRNWQAQDQAQFRDYSYEDQARFRDWQAQDQADFRNYAHADETNFRDRNYEDEYNFRERSYADQLTMYEQDYALALKELEVNREVGIRTVRNQERQQRWNNIGSIIGLATSIGSLFSDPRLKEDMTPIDKLPNGLTIYAYRFRDYLDGTGELRIGLDASEVQEVMPQHVSVNRGYLTVDYAAVIDEAMAEAG